MPRVHVVQQGETLVGLAARYGFAPRMLWEHPLNAELRARRQRMDVLYPGDPVTLPDLVMKQVTVQTGRTHVFTRKGVPAVFRLVLRQGGRPRVNVAYRIEVDRVVIEGITGEDGLIEARVPPNATEGKLFLEDRDTPLTLRLGHMDPRDTVSGVRKRLSNLGFPVPSTDDTTSEPWRRTLTGFQERAGLPRTGTLDDATRQALVRLHDQREARG